MQWKTKLTTLATSTLLFASHVSWANQAADSVAPEQSSGLETKQLVKANDWMVTAASPINASRLDLMCLLVVVTPLMPWLPFSLYLA